MDQVFLYCLLIISTLVYNGFGQEGSGEDPGSQLLRHSSDEQVAYEESATTTGDAVCVKKSLAGLGCNIGGNFKNHIFICPNGLIRFNDNSFLRYPQVLGTLQSQENDPVVGGFWADVDLPSFANGESKVLYNTYNKDIDAVNDQDIFTSADETAGILEFQDYGSTWVSVVTWTNVRPADYGDFTGKNTFQVVIISNGCNCIVENRYGTMDWSVPATSDQYPAYANAPNNPVAGVNVGKINNQFLNGQQFVNYHGSGTTAVEEIEDVMGNVGTGRFGFVVPGDPSQTAATKACSCIDWYRNATDISGEFFRGCPNNENQASSDKRYDRSDHNGVLCYSTYFPRDGPSARCCYSSVSGGLFVDPTSPGTTLSRNPRYYSSAVEANDDNGYNLCCLQSNLCNAYNTRRSKNFTTPRIDRAWAYGDPHFITFDNYNKTFVFKGCGDYVYVEADNKNLQVHVRMTRFIGKGTAISAVVIKQNGVGTVQVNYDSSGDFRIHLNGVEYIGYGSLSSTPVLVLNNGFTISKSGDTIDIISSDNNWLQVKRQELGLVVSVGLDSSLFGKTGGLMGPWNDDPNNDFQLPNGTTLSPSLSNVQIYDDFGQQWKVVNNIFVVTSVDIASDCENYTNPYAGNLTITNATLASEVASICGGNEDCVEQAAITGFASFGSSFQSTVNEVNVNLAVTSNTAPEVLNCNELNITINQQFQYTFNAIDADGHSLTFAASSSLSGVVPTTSSNSITVTLQTQTVNEFNVSVTVNDGYSRTQCTPTISLCACQNGGICEQQGTNSLVFNAFSVQDCVCPVGFTGDLCETARDFCSPASGTPCHPLVTCTNSPTTYVCGPCPAGYQTSGNDCDDVNECSGTTHGCQGLCVNTIGSYYCQCLPGYRLNTVDSKSCSDINECNEGSHQCMHQCTNTPGNYTCSCNANFVPDPTNAFNCVPETACPTGHSCSQVCAVIGGNQVCSCNAGYQLSSSTCVDINECTVGTHNCGQYCNNTVGGFTCSCYTSTYTLASDGYTCTDIDECTSGSPCTGTGEVCVNLAGGYKCVCNSNAGLIRIDGKCQAVQVTVAPTTAVNATAAQLAEAITITLIGSTQYDQNNHTALAAALADALNRYCNANDTVAEMCGLPGTGFNFNEQDILLVTGSPVYASGNTVLEIIVTYPDGTQNVSGVPVPRSIFLAALNAESGNIETALGANLLIGTTVTTSTTAAVAITADDGEVDWGLWVGISIGVVLLLGLCIAMAIMICCKTTTFIVIKKPLTYPLSVSMMEESSFTLSGESYEGFDCDGLPVNIDPNTEVAYLDGINYLEDYDNHNYYANDTTV